MKHFISNKNPWKTLKSEVKYENPWIKVVENKVIHPDGNEGIYGVVHYKHNAIGIIPIDENLNTWLVGQYRYPLNLYSWEIPEGGGKKSENPIIAAQRELKEETGIIAKKWTPLLEMHLSNSVSDEWGIIYVAEDLTFVEPNPDGSEKLEVKKVPLVEAIEMVMRGEITDSLSVAGLLKLAILKKLV